MRIRPVHGGLSGLCAALMIVIAGTAFAQSAPPKRRPPSPPVSDDGDGPSASVEPALRQSALPLTLRSAVSSRWRPAPVIARSVAGRCRASCATQRVACAQLALNGGDIATCDPGWTQCVSACDGLAYRRGP